MKGYSEYKITGFDWAPQIPKDWKLPKLKWRFEIFAGGTPSKNIDRYWENGTIPWINSGSVNQQLIRIPSSMITEEAYDNSSAKWIPKGSIVMALAGQGKTKGMTAILGIKSTCNQSMAAIVPKNKKVISRFFNYWLIANYKRIRGLAGDAQRDGLNLQIVGNIKCPTPSLPEQKQIAHFLDHQTGIIDALIAKKELLIEKLKEQRQATINEAVTKGLNPKAPLKHSGIAWLGEIPEHWEVVKLKYLVSKVGSGVTPRGGSEVYVDEGILFLRSQNIYSDGLRLDDAAFIPVEVHEKMKNSQVNKGDVLLNITGASIGRSFYWDTEGLEANVNQHVCIIRPANDTSTEYLHLLMTSLIGQVQIFSGQDGTSREGLNFEELKNFNLVIPPKEEIQEILSSVKTNQKMIGEALNKLESQIEKLHAYRQSLISEAVTGKIDVREWEPERGKN